QRTTPDQYPLTLNALVTACNQSTSREPVMSLADHEVQSVLTAMKAAGLVRMVHPSHGRSVTRDRQVFDEQRSLDAATCSVLSVMLLRGPQTVSELRTRTERLHTFDSLAAVEQCLADAVAAGDVQLLERMPGQKEQRWQQLIADEAEVVHAPSTFRSAHEPAAPGLAQQLAERVAELEARVERLEAALADLV
ncbi:MAG: hypothetical protein JWN99_3076, partial [Ilumatobacteraceae bacterium]|nr:hypothetical protein [Ilumatobacteraceae bacterium]